MEIKHEDLFATRIWVVDLNTLNNHFDAWRSKINRLRESDMQPRGKSNRLGWNSQPIIMTLPEFKPLFTACVKAFNAVIKVASPTRDYRYTIDAWANVNDRGGFNTLHCHPGALMSGVFYLSVPEGSGVLSFRDPRLGVVLGPFHGGAPNSSSEKTLTPREGMLAIFPNWLEHKVEPHGSDIQRVSIAMNAQQAIARI